MPTLARRRSVIFRKGLVDGSALTSSSGVATDDRPVCRSRSVLKRTASVPANTFNAIVKSTTKGARSFTQKPKRPCSTSLRPPSVLKKPATRLTTLLTAMSTLPTARVVSQKGEKLCLSASTNTRCGGLSKALSPCTSVMAVCSGIVGELGRYSICLQGNGEDLSQVSDPQVGVVIGSQQGPSWTMFVKRWITWQSWSSADWGECCESGRVEVSDSGRVEEIKRQKEVSPWLTVFQVSIIILLTASLCRNVERIWDL